MSRLLLDLDLFLEMGDTWWDEKKIFRLEIKFWVFGVADHEYTVRLSILTFISRWEALMRWKNFLRLEIKFQVFGVADHEYLFRFSIRTFNSRWETPD